MTIEDFSIVEVCFLGFEDYRKIIIFQRMIIRRLGCTFQVILILKINLIKVDINHSKNPSLVTHCIYDLIS